MSVRITVIGTGYVGLVTAAGLSDFGNTVIACDIDKVIIDKLSKGIPTIYEHDLEDYLQRNVTAGRLSFSSDVEYCLKNADVIFVAVGTPDLIDGSVDLSQINAVVESVASNLNSYKIIIIKSTVPVGTNRKIAKLLHEKTGEKNFAVVSNPEFLREGKAMHDFFHPDRVVLGCEDESAREVLKNIYRPLYLIQTPFVWCNFETAELIKYAANAFLATKITYINQMANLSEVVNADIHLIAKTMGMDGRISPKFLHPGPGFGGSCFPKDTKAIASMGREYSVEMSLVEEVIRANENQKLQVVHRLKMIMGDLRGVVVSVLGVAFKAETDDVRESPSITIVKKLLDESAVVHVHDPKALENFQKAFAGAIGYFSDLDEAVVGAECLLILTEWNSYRGMDLLKIGSLMKSKIIYDTRNVLDPEKARECGFKYFATGRSSFLS